MDLTQLKCEHSDVIRELAETNRIQQVLVNRARQLESEIHKAEQAVSQENANDHEHASTVA